MDPCITKTVWTWNMESLQTAWRDLRTQVIDLPAPGAFISSTGIRSFFCFFCFFSCKANYSRNFFLLELYLIWKCFILKNELSLALSLNCWRQRTFQVNPDRLNMHRYFPEGILYHTFEIKLTFGSTWDNISHGHWESFNNSAISKLDQFSKAD